ncbi:hypothetical protein BLNAU_23078 [Blattamonas nauphoetae]|uniref:Uncharacterized protein n=1 Tax=Blattamonas nauphoetae TaxID=2049346 RepID=A0ABQ9WRQ7_9EUKA|nr:hypothetical protein BLNAU_23078 [Blattamonas nauphoetae]
MDLPRHLALVAPHDSVAQCLCGPLAKRIVIAHMKQEAERVRLGLEMTSIDADVISLDGGIPQVFCPQNHVVLRNGVRLLGTSRE